MTRKPKTVEAAPKDETTPRPWMTGRESEDGRLYIAQQDGPGYVTRSVPKANAVFIVRAVNAHDALRAAGYEALKFICEASSDHNRDPRAVALRAALELAGQEDA